MKKFVAFLLMFVLALVFIGCGDNGNGGNEDVKPTKITLSETSVEIKEGGTRSIIASVAPKDATNKELEWKSSNEQVATVKVDGSKGDITAVAAGEADITVTAKADSSVKATVKVKVTSVELTALTVKGASQVIQGKAAQYTVTPTPEDAKVEVVWVLSLSADEEVDASEIATIDEHGILEVKKSGTVYVIAKSNGITSAAKAVTCVSSEDVVPVAFFTVDPTEYKVAVGKTVRIKRSIKGPIDPNGGGSSNLQATNTALHCTSSDESIATVSDDGVVTGVANGTVKITLVTDDQGENNSGPFSAEVTVTVFTLKTPTSWALSTAIPVDGGAEVGTNVDLVITVGDEEDASATFTSSDETVATVDANGKVTGLAAGQVTITAKSAVADLEDSIEITFKVFQESTEPEDITIIGDDEMYVGYDQKLLFTITPATALQSVTWTSNDETKATVDETGLVKALAEGTVRIKAVSTVNKKIQKQFKITITVEPTRPDVPNMGGYEIVIMNAKSALSDNDPFLEEYSQVDKNYKQRAWNEVQTEYNCKISVKQYPDNAGWGTDRINWINNTATTNQAQCDLGIVPTNWIHYFAKAGSAVDVTRFYSIYGKKQMEPTQKEGGSYHGKIYIASTGLSKAQNYIGLGLYYNYGMIKAKGLQDPATLFNEGKWNYTGFAEWVRSTQATLGSDVKVLGGHPYYYYYGMTNAAGVRIADSILCQVNITSSVSRNAMTLLNDLVKDGCVSTALTWGESKTPDGHDFFDEGVLMISGDMWFVRNKDRWSPSHDLKWTGEPEFGYVPFPYPDNVNKEDTRIGVSGQSVYLYLAGRDYPAGMKTEYVYDAMNEMFLRTIQYETEDETFKPREQLYNSLTTRLDNPASIEAAMFYDSSKIIYDPAHGIYLSTSSSVLPPVCMKVAYQGEDFETSFKAVQNQYLQDLLNVYG